MLCLLVHLFDRLLVLDVAVVGLVDCFVVALGQGRLVVVGHLFEELFPLVLLLHPLPVVIEYALQLIVQVGLVGQGD